MLLRISVTFCKLSNAFQYNFAYFSLNLELDSPREVLLLLDELLIDLILLSDTFAESSNSVIQVDLPLLSIKLNLGGDRCDLVYVLS